MAEQRSKGILSWDRESYKPNDGVLLLGGMIPVLRVARKSVSEALRALTDEEVKP